MRYINKKRRKKKKSMKSCILIFSAIAICLFGFCLWKNQSVVLEYERENCTGKLYQCNLPVDELCVNSNNVLHSSFETGDEFHAIAFMNLNEKKFLYAQNMHEKLYPASTTKLMTAYLALKHGVLDEMVTITENAQDIPIDSSRAGLRLGDKLLLKDLLYALLLPSGNDAAVAIAEHISGSVEEFVKLMNEEAFHLGATNTNFVNPHGYQDDNHYTTAYDLYLIFKSCLKIPEFQNIVSAPEYHLQITQQNGTYRNECWKQTNWYVNGYMSEPDGVHVVGGKTGTTDEAGSCLITLFIDESENLYIAMIMGAENRSVLYDNMNRMITSVLQ